MNVMRALQSAQNMKRRSCMKLGTYCSNCAVLEKAHSIEINDLQQKISTLEKNVLELHAVIANASNSDRSHHFEQAQLAFNGSSVNSEEFCASDITMDQFDGYFTHLLRKYPILAFFVQLLLSITHIHKAKASATSSQWKQWAALYKCFILEVVLRSKNAKATFRTPILLGLLCIYGNVSDSVWHVLRMLRIVCLRSTIEKWIRSQPITTVSSDNVTLLSFDNCDFYRHVTNVRTDNRSAMIHTCTMFIAMLCHPVTIEVSQIWHSCSKNQLIDFLHCDFDFANLIATTAYSAVKSVSEQTWLKFAPIAGHSSIKKSEFVILDPILNCNTSTYVDVARTLDSFWEQYMAQSDRTFLFVSVDQACFARVWGLKKQFPQKYSWVIPVPGEWHWCWHILQGIFKIWGDYMFVPLSRTLNYLNLDVSAKNFHYAEDFLQLVTLALIRLVSELTAFHANCSITDLMNMYEQNLQVYQLVYLLSYYLCPYWLTRSAIKSGNSELVNRMWRYWLHLFIATRKTNYTQLTI